MSELCLILGLTKIREWHVMILPNYYFLPTPKKISKLAPQNPLTSKSILTAVFKGFSEKKQHFTFLL